MPSGKLNDMEEKISSKESKIDLRKKRIFFFHIMKTGGTTLTLLLDKQFDIEQICPARHWYELDLIKTNDIKKYIIFRGHFNLSQLYLFDEFPFALTVIRNPVDRVISEYNHWRRAPDAFAIHHPAYAEISRLAKKLSIQEFIKYEVESGFFISNRQTYQLALLHSMPRPTVGLDPELALEKAKENLAKFQIVGTTETIRQIVDVLCFFFRWMPPTIIPNVRATENDESRTISMNLRDELTERNRLDFQLYNYAQERIKILHNKIARDIGIISENTTGQNYGAMYNALQLNYETSYKSRHPEMADEYKLDFAQAIDGDGWHERQYDPKKHLTWRWTGPGNISTLDLPLVDSRDLRISFDILNVADPSLLNSMVIRVNEVSIKYSIENNMQIQTCSFQVPVCVLKKTLGRTRLSIEINKTVKIRDRYPQSYIFAGLAISGLRAIPSVY